MRPGGRAAAAIEVLQAVLERHQPAGQALKDWARDHRFAGSADRSAIGNLVYDALRRRNSLTSRMGSDDARVMILAAAHESWQMKEDEDAFAAAMAEEHGPGALSPDERRRLAAGFDPLGLPLDIAGDIPQWLVPSFTRAFGGRAAVEAAALAMRAPIDLRANTLKAPPGKVLKTLAKFGAVPGPLSPLSIRIPAPHGNERAPNVEAEAGYQRGWFEVQDAGSQVAALLVGAQAEMQVLDLCAGGGGKTLAMAAAMQNRGQIFAHDRDRQRLKPIHERLQRASVRNTQVIPADEPERLAGLAGRFDRVLIDAPCSGSGAWRRKPDAKWRLSDRQLDLRIGEQRALLDQGAGFVKPGGRLVYVTCSLLPEENEDQLAGFLARRPDFIRCDIAAVWRETIGTEAPGDAVGDGSVTLTPARDGTDGFFVGVLVKK
jgi:16S rRNA (cytosine967-C5)-methyltransferase